LASALHVSSKAFSLLHLAQICKACSFQSFLANWLERKKNQFLQKKRGRKSHSLQICIQERKEKDLIHTLARVWLELKVSRITWPFFDLFAFEENFLKGSFSAHAIPTERDIICLSVSNEEEIEGQALPPGEGLSCKMQPSKSIQSNVSRGVSLSPSQAVKDAIFFKGTSRIGHSLLRQCRDWR